MPTPNHVPHPVEREPDDLVENVYPVPGTLDMPDLESQDTMSEYLMDRFAPDPGPRTRLVLAETGKTLPRIERHVVGMKDTAYWERDGWLISPRVSAAVILGSAVLSVAKPAALDVYDEANQVRHDVYRYFYPVPSTDVTVEHREPTVGPIQHIKVNADAENLPGSALVDQAAVTRFGNQVAKVIKRNGEIVSVTITGRSSDDYGSNESVGRPESPAQDFADDRAASYASALRDTELFKNTPILTAVDQNVLTPKQVAKVEQAAEDAGFTGPDNIIDALNSVASGNQSGSRLERLIDKFFTSKRGVTLDAAVTLPGVKGEKITYTEETVPGEDNPPADPDRDYDPWLIPLPPIPRLRRIKDGLKPIKRFRLLPGKKIFTPSILKEEEDQAWLRIRPEAVQKDGSLVENPWAFTRKYEHLLRDGRIVDVLRADFKNPKGEDKSLRIMFVDKSPAAETIAAFEDLLSKFSSMQDGQLAEKVSGIFVYPSENTGTRHRDPKRIAMGIDKQSSEHLLGTYTYILDLVELHMPSTWNPDELEEMFHSFYGPRWTLAHEVAGHGTDDNNAPLRLRRVHARGIPQAHVIHGDSRAERMRPLHGLLRRLPRSNAEKVAPSLFDITYPVTDNEGRTVTVPARVTENDPRLAHATTSTIVGQQPTRYSDESVTEHYAETAAAVVTGDTVPYDEALVDVPQLTTDDGQTAAFATGYRPDTRGQRLFTDEVGAQAGSYPITFAKPADVTISHVAPANDPLIRQELIRTRRLRSLRPDQMIAILARVSQRDKEAEQ